MYLLDAITRPRLEVIIMKDLNYEFVHQSVLPLLRSSS